MIPVLIAALAMSGSEDLPTQISVDVVADLNQRLVAQGQPPCQPGLACPPPLDRIAADLGTMGFRQVPLQARIGPGMSRWQRTMERAADVWVRTTIVHDQPYRVTVRLCESCYPESRVRIAVASAAAAERTRRR